MVDDDYRWFDLNGDLRERFPSWCSGVSAWVRGLDTLHNPSPESAHEWLEQIRQSRRKPTTCPRVFVSHRQSDVDQALRIAWLAQDKGWSYWLDLVDLQLWTPQTNAAQNQPLAALERWLRGSPTDLQVAILTAAIIEMGLLNCSHVIAAMTHNSRGSQWIPYEYGRVKEATLVAMNVASWWDSTTLQNHQPPEYLYLAPILDDEKAIRGWLQTQMLQMKQGRYPNCPGKQRHDWPQHIQKPGPLPTG